VNPVRLVTAKELACLLHATPRWVYLQVETNDLPAYRLGRSLRFDLDAVEAWLDARKVGAWQGSRSCANPISRVPL
jgi:excisionase family DNA binding protein